MGAGPGDPDLITARGIHRIQQADIIFHDKLSPSELIEQYAPEDARVEDVGKRKGKVGPSQDEINQKLVDASKHYKRVVRLKGGDPYLFGRGGEEAEYLQSSGVSFEVVPGISSLLSVPNYAGIPVTHRDYASSLAVVTGHPGPRGETPNWQALSSIDTLVIMMGITRAGEISQTLIEHGRSPETPVALIGWGTTPDQHTRMYTLGTLKDGVNNPSEVLPGLIVVGEVANLRSKLNWFESRPLFGKRIIVTRPSHQNQSITRSLWEEGANPLCYPTIEIEPLETGLENLRESCSQLDRFDWVIFTSRNGVRIFFDTLKETGRDTRALGSTRLATIGKRTAEKCVEYGCRADFVPTTYQAEDLAEGLLEKLISPANILLPRAKGARKILPNQLSNNGHTVKEIQIYESTPAAERSRSGLESVFSEQTADMITFTSASTVNHLFQMFSEKEQWLRSRLEGVETACIGPITAGQLQEKEISVDVVPDQYTVEHLLEAIRQHYAHTEGGT